MQFEALRRIASLIETRPRTLDVTRMRTAGRQGFAIQKHTLPKNMKNIDVNGNQSDMYELLVALGP